jgi:hypothetical protein
LILPSLLFAYSAFVPAPALCVAEPAGPAVRHERVVAVEEAQVPPDSSLAAAYATGVTWDAFLSSAWSRRAAWMKNWENARIPADALAQARALPPGFRLLVIAVDSCSDSVNTIPYLAKLVAEVPGLGMRILSPTAGRNFVAARPTPDGRPATPTVIVLDARGEEVGCWIERPMALQAMAIEARAGGGTPAFAATKQGWYDTDAGASTIREVVALLADAASGVRGCDALAASRSR